MFHTTWAYALLPGLVIHKIMTMYIVLYDMGSCPLNVIVHSFLFHNLFHSNITKCNLLCKCYNDWNTKDGGQKDALLRRANFKKNTRMTFKNEVFILSQLILHQIIVHACSLFIIVDALISERKNNVWPDFVGWT